MRSVEPQVFLVARPKVDYEAMAAYLREVGGERWLERIDRGQLEAQDLAEFAGKICYRSWEPGLNPNVRKVRDDQEVYLQNILKQAHGSVLEHVSFSFVLHNVSRVFTHEIARHRPGTAISQESLRYVRLDELPFWFPDWAREDAELMKRATALLTELEQFQQWLAGHFGLDEDDTRCTRRRSRPRSCAGSRPRAWPPGWSGRRTSAPCGTPSRRAPTRAPRRRSGWCSARSAS
jgi:thymidylate synthase (FAD)